MPRYDGTGPWGQGPMSGRGMGPCAQGGRYGAPFGYGRGMGRRCYGGRGMPMMGAYYPPVREPSLNEHKQFLEEQLKEIDALIAKEGES